MSSLYYKNDIRRPNETVWEMDYQPLTKKRHYLQLDRHILYHRRTWRWWRWLIIGWGGWHLQVPEGSGTCCKGSNGTKTNHIDDHHCIVSVLRSVFSPIISAVLVKNHIDDHHCTVSVLRSVFSPSITAQSWRRCQFNRRSPLDSLGNDVNSSRPSLHIWSRCRCQLPRRSHHCTVSVSIKKRFGHEFVMWTSFFLWEQYLNALFPHVPVFFKARVPMHSLSRYHSWITTFLCTSLEARVIRQSYGTRATESLAADGERSWQDVFSASKPMHQHQNQHHNLQDI